ncbi:hypothetical protein PUNSTDRAFT_133451 [Punctularia strigosozonata HHB-11173 SS5]|uniref:uncharacterized protein n=1 Tax=Punctularia strigosozonata (strain HHB-11173) TaxID=741275 RepID=UPI0004417625|nr:uncharacterized protein PUNSTDRAFT_133451 [Punctularia strigosozonata HHB-11173 SS5]EIN09674.1 hypothetical protein PUNSTDRAFT_133451 [Punctularia strigosozonata HHB-11173 SS5]
MLMDELAVHVEGLVATLDRMRLAQEALPTQQTPSSDIDSDSDAEDLARLRCEMMPATSNSGTISEDLTSRRAAHVALRNTGHSSSHRLTTERLRTFESANSRSAPVSPVRPRTRAPVAREALTRFSNTPRPPAFPSAIASPCGTPTSQRDPSSMQVPRFSTPGSSRSRVRSVPSVAHGLALGANVVHNTSSIPVTARNLGLSRDAPPPYTEQTPCSDNYAPPPSTPSSSYGTFDTIPTGSSSSGSSSSRASSRRSVPAVPPLRNIGTSRSDAPNHGVLYYHYPRPGHIRGKKYITVTVGREVGVFANWNEAKHYVIGCPDNAYQGYRTLEDAHDVFLQTWREGKVREVPY